MVYHTCAIGPDHHEGSSKKASWSAMPLNFVLNCDRSPEASAAKVGSECRLVTLMNNTHDLFSNKSGESVRVGLKLPEQFNT